MSIRKDSILIESPEEKIPDTETSLNKDKNSSTETSSEQIEDPKIPEADLHEKKEFVTIQKYC